MTVLRTAASHLIGHCRRLCSRFAPVAVEGRNANAKNSAGGWIIVPFSTFQMTQTSQQTRGSKDDPPATELIARSVDATATNAAVDAYCTMEQRPQGDEFVMSKSQMKKLQKRERMMKARKERKEKKKEANRTRAIAQGRDLQAEHQFLLKRTASGDRKKRLQLLWDSEKLPLAKASFHICLDCSYEHVMTDKEIGSLASQLRYCYSYNKKSPHPCLWAATSLGGQTLACLENVSGYSEWVHRCYTGTSQSLQDYYKERLDSVVYLTSDSSNTITHLDNDKIYVIGGIVDRNRLKRVALERAQHLGVPTARLPLAEHLEQMPATRVLTCNHVMDILLKYREYGNDWNKALQQVLPARKEAEFKENT